MTDPNLKKLIIDNGGVPDCQADFNDKLFLLLSHFRYGFQKLVGLSNEKLSMTVEGVWTAKFLYLLL